jgi:hypothetical protein
MSFMVRQDLLRADQNLARLKKIYFDNREGTWSDETAGLVINTLDRLHRTLKELINNSTPENPPSSGPAGGNGKDFLDMVLNLNKLKPEEDD